MPRGRSGKKTEDVVLKSAELLGWALGGIEREIAQTRERLASLTAQANALRERVGKDARSAVRSAVKTARDASTRVSGAGVEGGPDPKRRQMSAEGRRRISEMMKKRWADRRKRDA